MPTLPAVIVTLLLPFEHLFDPSSALYNQAA